MKTLAAVLLVAPVAAIAGGGTVVKLDGKATIQRKGVSVPVAESTPVYSGDTLRVAEKAAAQVRFEDDSVFVVPGAATLRVDRFTMSHGGKAGQALYTLVDGGVRTVTGKVSKGEGDKYELRTEEATITVQGSAYMALRCTGACAAKHKGGLYVKGESGVITVGNDGGQAKVTRGQTVFVAAGGGAPVRVKMSPFDDPAFGVGFALSVDFDVEVHPPRLEPEPPVSPS